MQLLAPAKLRWQGQGQAAEPLASSLLLLCLPAGAPDKGGKAKLHLPPLLPPGTLENLHGPKTPALLLSIAPAGAGRRKRRLQIARGVNASSTLTPLLLFSFLLGELPGYQGSKSYRAAVAQL